jgi:formylglycine-generating enzyme required for sulfatase activity
MVAVPGGTFTMGSPAREKGRRPDEGPQVQVEVEPFYLGRLEVTWPEYEAFTGNWHRVAVLAAEGRPAVPAAKMADAVTYPTPMYNLEMGPMLERMGGRGPGFPAVTVSHFSARQYCKWLSKKTGRFYRLPTEAEWEYACRAGTNTAYSFGDDPRRLEDAAWYFDNSDRPRGDSGYSPVGRKKPNAWGIYDMHGNVAEWCTDQYDANWYAKFAGRGKVKAAELINWPTRRYPCVLRGGSFESEAEDCRSARRIASTPQLNNLDPDLPKSPHWETDGLWVGFRVASPVAEPTESEKLRFWDAADQSTREALKQREKRQARELVERVDPAPADAKDRPR